MDTIRALESVFERVYATEMMKKMYGVFKKTCSGCQQGRLSQADHTCLSLTEYELLDSYMDDILREVNDSEVLNQWESTISTMRNISPEAVDTYKLKIYCRDWRETDMKTVEWKSKMYRLICQFIRLDCRLR